MSRARTNQNPVIRIRRDTRKVFDRVRKEKGWTMTEAVHRAAQLLLNQEAAGDGSRAPSTVG